MGVGDADGGGTGAGGDASDVASLLALLETVPTEVPPEELYVEDFRQYFLKWVDDTAIGPGKSMSLTAGDLYRHFQEYCEVNGLPLPTIGKERFGRALKDLGLTRGRLVIAGRDRKLYCMNYQATQMFRAWLREHPQPPRGQDPFQVTPPKFDFPEEK